MHHFGSDPRSDVSAAKAALIYAGVHFLGKTSLKMARLTRMSGQAASRARIRGAEIQAKIDLNKLISDSAAKPPLVFPSRIRR
jgi:hypothetical protein